MSTNAWKRQGIKAALAEGADEATATIGGSHMRLRITKGGRSRTVFMSRSPSDHRTVHNMKRDIRKVLRELAGVA